MALFVLSDPHLSIASQKPMDIFGERWKDHKERIEYFWKKTVADIDTVVLPGDISWGMTMEEALPDLRFLDALPGRKILGKGNHDYWWGTAGKINGIFKEQGLTSLFLLFNNAYPMENVALCGTRGWFTDAASPGGVDKEKIVHREAGRLERSLLAGRALEKEELLVFLHFPPVLGDFYCTPLMEVLKRYGVKRCFYGHMHGQYSIPKEFTREGISFSIASADYLQFVPLPIPLAAPDENRTKQY